MEGGKPVQEPELPLLLDILLRRYPGYDAERLLAEPADLIEDWLLIAEEQAKADEERRRKAEAAAKSGGR